MSLNDIDKQFVDKLHTRMYEQGQIKPAIATSYNDLKQIFDIHLPNIVGRFGGNLDDLRSNYGNTCNVILRLVEQFLDRELFKKRACQAKDMIGTCMVFQAAGISSGSHILNIGLCTGMAAMSIMECFPGAYVTTIDPMIDDIEAWETNWGSKYKDRHAIFHGTTLHADNINKHMRLVGKEEIKENSTNMLKAVKNIDAIFQDGDHTFNYVLEELGIFKDIASKQGKKLIVGLHDQAPHMKPAQAADKFNRIHKPTFYRFEGLGDNGPRIAAMQL